MGKGLDLEGQSGLMPGLLLLSGLFDLSGRCLFISFFVRFCGCHFITPPHTVNFLPSIKAYLFDAFLIGFLKKPE